jgi:hypothetical protein
MKSLVIAFTTLVLLSLPTFAERPFNVGNMHTVTKDAFIEPFPAISSPPSCVCSCGKNCEGGCAFYVSGCGLGMDLVAY